MAMSARSVGRADLVREGLSEALRLEPNLVPAMYYLGEIEIQAGKLNSRTKGIRLSIFALPR